MTIESIASITSFSRELFVSDTQRLNFADFLMNEVQEANSKINVADQEVRALAVGETDNLHHVMLSVAKAQTAFELVVEIRNRILEGYQEINRMQI